MQPPRPSDVIEGLTTRLGYALHEAAVYEAQVLRLSQELDEAHGTIAMLVETVEAAGGEIIYDDNPEPMPGLTLVADDGE